MGADCDCLCTRLNALGKIENSDSYIFGSKTLFGAVYTFFFFKHYVFYSKKIPEGSLLSSPMFYAVKLAAILAKERNMCTNTLIYTAVRFDPILVASEL